MADHDEISPTPDRIGGHGVAENGQRITNIHLPMENRPEENADEDALLLRDAGHQIQGNLSGERKGFTVPLAPGGVGFAAQVWKALLEDPYGGTRSYGEIAAPIQRPDVSKTFGYAAGLKIKKKLLGLERRHARY